MFDIRHLDTYDNIIEMACDGHGLEGLDIMRMTSSEATTLIAELIDISESHAAKGLASKLAMICRESMGEPVISKGKVYDICIKKELQNG